MTKTKKRPAKKIPTPLNVRTQNAVDDRVIKESFTTRDIDNWIIDHNIRKSDGSKHTRECAATLLSQSHSEKRNTTYGNSIWLDRRMNNDGPYEYLFCR